MIMNIIEETLIEKKENDDNLQYNKCNNLWIKTIYCHFIGIATFNARIREKLLKNLINISTSTKLQ